MSDRLILLRYIVIFYLTKKVFFTTTAAYSTEMKSHILNRERNSLVLIFVSTNRTFFGGLQNLRVSNGLS